MVPILHRTALLTPMPALNEASIIQRTLNELKQYVEGELPTKTYEILVIDDGSTDSMANIVEEMARRGTSIQLVRHRYNMGRGAQFGLALRMPAVDL